MEPLAIQSGVSQTVRPVLALDANLTAVLREGRTVAGEVLQALDGKSVMIGLGRHRVAVNSQVEMAPGDRFLARVEQTPEGTVLKVLGGQAGAESKLLVALRSVVGNDLPVGELLEKLGGSLRAAIERGDDGSGKLAKLMKSLGKHVYVPGSSGEELQRLLAQSGMDHEAVMVELATKSQAAKAAQPLQELATKLLSAMRAAFSGAGINLSKAEFAKLKAQLESVFADLSGSSERGATHESLVKSLTTRLRAALAELPEGKTREALNSALPATVAKILGGDTPNKLAQALLLALGSEADLRSLEQNLKAQLMNSLSQLGEGAEREAVKRTLAGIEAEQLLNVARKEFADGWHLSLPVPDGDGLATANLYYRDSHEHDQGEARDEAELKRMTLTVDFTSLGPLRAELGVRDDLVALRLLVTRPEVAEAIDGRIDELRERIAFGGREARIAVVLGTREQAAVDSLSQNVRWLQEHHLMDLSG